MRYLLNLRVLLAVLALLGVVVLSTGCPPKDVDGENQVISAEGDTSALPIEYRYPLPDSVKTLDPAHITDTISSCVTQRIFNNLIRLSPEGEIYNDLAEWHVISDDGLTYKFKIREDVRFHNGESVTAEDVAYSYRRLLDPAVNSERANLLYNLVGAREFHDGAASELPGIEVVDEYTIKLVLTHRYAPFINVLTMTNFGVVPRSAVEQDPQGFGDSPVGTGPFVFDKWDKDQQIVLKSNRDYFKEQARINTVIFRIIPNEKTRFENFRSGALEHCDVPPSQVDQVMNDPELKPLVTGVPAQDMYCFGFNCDEPPFKDNTALRQAFSFAVDRDNIINNLLGGTVTEQKTYVPSGMFYHWDESEGYAYDPERAAELLSEAGYPEGRGLDVLTLDIGQQPIQKRVAEAVQEDLRKIGVEVRIQPHTKSTLLDKVYGGDSLFFQNTWLADYPDPDNWLYQLLHTENFGDPGNITRWSNSEFDLYVKDAQKETDPARRAELYKKAERIAFDEAPWLLVYWKNNATLVKPYAKGLITTALDRTPELGNTPLEEVYFEKE